MNFILITWWYVVSDDDCLSQTIPVTITVEDCSNISELTNEVVDIFPNPTSDQINAVPEHEILNYQSLM